MENSFKIKFVVCFVVLLIVSGIYLYGQNSNKIQIVSASMDSAPNPLAFLYSNVSIRQPTANDVPTGTYFQTPNGNVYELFNSRSLDKFDYGKTFVVRVK